jgi:hypothetical protein
MSALLPLRIFALTLRPARANQQAAGRWLNAAYTGTTASYPFPRFNACTQLTRVEQPADDIRAALGGGEVQRCKKGFVDRKC